jgi:hypothetical protein
LEGRLPVLRKPLLHIVGMPAQKAANLDSRRQIATGGMAVVDGLLGKTKHGRQLFRREERRHSAMFLFQAVT